MKPRYFVGNLVHSLKLQGTTYRLMPDGVVSWRRPDTPTVWFNASEEDCYQTADDILSALQRGELVEVLGDPTSLATSDFDTR